MEGNNFKQLYEEEEYAYQTNHQHKVRANIWGTLGLFRLVGDLVDVFLPRVMDVFVMASGARAEKSERGPLRGKEPPSESVQRSDPGKIAPRAPEEDEQD
mgnify:FL=1